MTGPLTSGNSGGWVFGLWNVGCALTSSLATSTLRELCTSHWVNLWVNPGAGDGERAALPGGGTARGQQHLEVGVARA
jgi:hypothetical protein